MKPLEADLRQLLHPNTAKNLKVRPCRCSAAVTRELVPSSDTLPAQESRKNQLKDFVHVAGPLRVSHFLILTATEQAAYLRLCKVPKVCRLQRRPAGGSALADLRQQARLRTQGPTVTLRITEYALMHDLAAASSAKHSLSLALAHAPLVRSRTSTLLCSSWPTALEFVLIFAPQIATCWLSSSLAQ